jgi:hypothetical protein
MLSASVHASRGQGTPIPGPGTPFTSLDVESFPQETSAALVMEYAEPSGILAYAPDNRLGPDGTPADFLSDLGDDIPTQAVPVPNTPVAWRRADTSNSQPIESAQANLRDNNAAAVAGWGFVRPPTEYLQYDETIVPLSPTLFPDARYEGATIEDGPANYQWQAWANPAPITNAGDIPLTAITPYVTEL